MKRYYILYDGRAEYQSTDNCTVLEALGERFNKRDYDFWAGTDAVLVEYRQKTNNVLEDERIIGHLREGFNVLYDRTQEDRHGS